MALIKCPECGRENVSDNAEMCPDCGYGIKAHFNRIKAEEANEIQRQKIAKEREKQLERESNIIERYKDSNTKPNLPKISAIQLFFIILGIFILLMSITNKHGYNVESIIASLVFIIFGVLLYLIKYAIHIHKWRNYESYRMEFAHNEVKQIKEEVNQSTNINLNVPRCPICNSTNIKKITLSTRAVKTAAFGVVGAVDDAGKTYKCGNCGSKF